MKNAECSLAQNVLSQQAAPAALADAQLLELSVEELGLIGGGDVIICW